jgi:hypothetical protein
MRAARLRRRDLIRASKSQLNLLLVNQAVARGDQAPAVVPVRRHHKDLPENQLEQQIRDFLAWRGFISIRQHVGTFLPLRIARQLHGGQISFEQALRNVVRVGEEGAADWLSAKPTIATGKRPLEGPHAYAMFFWECKAPGKRPTETQLAWMEKRRQVGIEATWFNQFQLHDRPTPACEPRESHVFQVWFVGYFNAMRRET